MIKNEKKNRGCYIRTTDSEKQDAKKLSEMTGMSVSDIYREGYKLYKKLVHERLIDAD